jgi:hypothetical protein
MASDAWVGVVPLEATLPTVAESDAHTLAFARLLKLHHQHRIPRQNITTAVADSVVVWVPEENLVETDQAAPLPEPAKKKRTKIIHEIRVLDPPLSDTDMRLLDAHDVEYTPGIPWGHRNISNHFKHVDERGVHHRPGPKRERLRFEGWYLFKCVQEGLFSSPKPKKPKRKG